MKNNGNKNGFVLYHNFFNQIVLLSMEERGELFTAIFEYTRDGKTETELSPMVGMAFSFIKDTLDRDRDAYAARCEQNAENGRKGGRPRKQFFSSETERFSEKPKKADKDKEKEKEKENENENENDIEKEKERDKDARVDPTDAEKSEGEELDARVSSAVPFPAPRLSEETRAFLKKKGIPDGYVTARLERAVTHARQRNRSVAELLLEWWQADRDRTPWNLRHTDATMPSGLLLPSSSFDTDDFFQAALNHSLREMGLIGTVEKRTENPKFSVP